ncbi:hypothetical protein QJQ45_024851, partial [Haematococcus lacustris]
VRDVPPSPVRDLKKRAMMHWIVAALLLCATSCHTSSVKAARLPVRTASAPTPPVFPDTYTVTFDVSLPHLYLTQPQGLKFPVTVWRDGANQRMRIEVLGGLDTVLSLADVEYSVYPRINVTRCGVYRYRSGSHNDVDSVFPDLAGWEFGGDITLDGEAAQIWQFQHKSGDKVGSELGGAAGAWHRTEGSGHSLADLAQLLINGT